MKPQEVNKSDSDREKARVQSAYLQARKQLELVEVELNRSRIVIVNEEGKITRVPVLNEH